MAVTILLTLLWLFCLPRVPGAFHCSLAHVWSFEDWLSVGKSRARSPCVLSVWGNLLSGRLPHGCSVQAELVSPLLVFLKYVPWAQVAPGWGWGVRGSNEVTCVSPRQWPRASGSWGWKAFAGCHLSARRWGTVTKEIQPSSSQQNLRTSQ